jgi:transposase InsO family protein
MKAYPVTVLCRVMGVSRSGFYEYFRRYIRNLVRPPAQSAVASRARLIFKQSHGSYGSRRIAEQLKAEGHRVGRYKARRLMRQLGLKVKISRRYKLTTDSRHSFPVAQNLVNRNFEVGSPNVTWTADITYVWTLEGWLYLAVVMDLCSRQIVGWAMDRRMKKKLTLEALAMAYFRRKPAPGLIHHSDRGSQYACHEYQKRLKQYGMIPSMSRKGDCWDNSPMERFFRSLKSERLAFCRFETRQSARLEVLDYIGFYNADRLHSSLGYLSPMQYEKEQLSKSEAA